MDSVENSGLYTSMNYRQKCRLLLKHPDFERCECGCGAFLQTQLAYYISADGAIRQIIEWMTNNYTLSVFMVKED